MYKNIDLGCTFSVDLTRITLKISHVHMMMNALFCRIGVVPADGWHALQHLSPGQPEAGHCVPDHDPECARVLAVFGRFCKGEEENEEQIRGFVNLIQKEYGK